MPTNSCQYNKVVDHVTKRPRICYCNRQCRMLQHEFIIKIQSSYRGHYIRLKLKMFCKLPRELQRKIIWHMNGDIYARHRNKTIVNILYNRYKKFYDDFTNNNMLNDLSHYDSVAELFEPDLQSIIILTIKYKLLFDKDRISSNVRTLLSILVAKCYVNNLKPDRRIRINNSILYKYVMLIM